MHEIFMHERTEVMQEEVQIFSLIREINNRISVKLNQVYAPYGLTAVQFEILMELMMENNLTMSTLAQHLAMSNSNLSAIIKRLEGHGFVKRIRDPMDQRTVHVVLCETGKKNLEEMCEKECKKHVLEELPKAESRMILQGLEKLNQILKECDLDE